MTTTLERLEYNRSFVAAWTAARKAADPAGWREYRREINLRYRQNHRDQAKAWVAVHRAVERGQLVVPSACQHCGVERPLQASHHDYTRRLDVEFLCVTCHAAKDRALRAERKASA